MSDIISIIRIVWISVCLTHEKNLNKKQTRNWMKYVRNNWTNKKPQMFTFYFLAPSYQIICDWRDFTTYITAGRHLAPDSYIYM